VRSLSVAGRSDAASTSASKSSSTAGSSPSPAQPQQPPPGAPAERHANGTEEQALDADVAADVNAAPLAKVSGNTLERVETGLDPSSLDGAHIREADDTELEVLVNESLEVTAGQTTEQT
jgi:hypothetical protein